LSALWLLQMPAGGSRPFSNRFRRLVLYGSWRKPVSARRIIKGRIRVSDEGGVSRRNLR